MHTGKNLHIDVRICIYIYIYMFTYARAYMDMRTYRCIPTKDPYTYICSRMCVCYMYAHHKYILNVSKETTRRDVSQEAVCYVSITQGVQVANILRFLVPEKPFRVWFLEPETSNIGYLDPLGVMLCKSRSDRSEGFRAVRVRRLLGAPLCGRTLTDSLGAYGSVRTYGMDPRY